MKEYRTILVVNRKIYDKIELYRQFLEKSEFGTALNRALFIADDSVEELSSAEFNNAHTCIYLYGKIDKSEYAVYYNSIEEKRKVFQNTTFYMLFCQDKAVGEPYDESFPANESVNKTFSIELFEEESELSAKLEEELRYIKLLSLSLAISKTNETGNCVEFESYYMNASVTPDYTNIYYAVMHVLCEDADLINEKEREIKKNNELVSILKAQNDSICVGHFGNAEPADSDTGLKHEFSAYESTEELQRDMERAYRIGQESVEKSIQQKIDVARCAMAIEEKYKDDLILEVNDGHIDFKRAEKSRYFQKYMSANEVKTPGAAKFSVRPSDLLNRPVDSKNINSVQIRALLPLAREFERSRKFSPWATILTSLGVTVLFLMITGLLYFARYKVAGINGVTTADFLNVLLFPAAALLLTGITGLIVQLIRLLYSKSVFRKVFDALWSFISSRREICDKIKEYINTYLTVYYNYHIKHARIEDLHEQNIVLENEIKDIRDNVSPKNVVADTICALNGSRIEIPKLELGKNADASCLSMKKNLETLIKEDTEVSCSDQSIRTTSPWAKKIAYGRGNMNTGGDE